MTARENFRSVTRSRELTLLVVSLCALSWPSCIAHAIEPASPAPQQISAADLQFFESRVRPVLVENCYKCHSRDADKVKGGLMLDTREGLLHGGNSGAAIEPGKPDDSLLIEAIRYTDEDLQMPPKGQKLSDQQIADLTEWVRRGAPDPRSLAAKGSAASYGGVGKAHWAFQPVKKPAVPAVKNAAWCRTPIDNFILEKLEASDLAPNPAADKRTLLRRVTFDLVGLPPSEAEMQAFLADDSPDAYAKVVDRLLASSQYGEHWGRYWLDLARYADTKGDPPKRDDPRYPNAWTYRDYVIDAFNSDKPYNQFVLEQLAADRLIVASAKDKKHPDPTPEQQSTLAALGFLTVGNTFDGMKNDIINDQIDVTTKAFLGLTVSCARCHDHKFDPIPTKDYYSLYGIFASSAEPTELPFVRPVKKTAAYDDYVAQRAELEKKEAQVQADFVAFRRSRQRNAEKRKELVREQILVQREIGDLESTHPGAPARAMVVFDSTTPHDYPVLLRGEAENKGDVVPRRFLEILSGPNRPAFKNGSGRLELAQAIVDPKNPMTARVLVNRVWQQHFGRGFVATPDDLGNMSTPPTHPELLDFLAAQFIEQGWSIKKLHREIVLSSVYQESSAPNPGYAEVDPDNTLLWRANLRRLDFEELHDALLAISGTLDLKTIGGKSVPIGDAGFITRRAVYTYIDRRNPPELLTQFDFPNPNVPSGKRYETIVPQQSLFLMNSPLVIETARKLVHNDAFLALDSDPARVAALYEAIFQRPPDATETKLCLKYVASNPGGASTDAPASTPMSQLASRAAQQQQRQAERAARNLRRGSYQPEPGGAALQSRAPLDAWTKLAHALFQTNEAMFLN